MARTKKVPMISVTAEDRVHVGLDVHKTSIHVAVWKNGSLAAAWVTSADYAALVEQLEWYRPALRRVAYEAGPTGFVLARLLASRGLPVMVCAPSKMPRSSGDETKCDRLDARKIAEYAAKDILPKVAIPTERQERERALVRHRNHVVKTIQRVKARIKSRLLFHQCGELASWTPAERQRLLDSELPEEIRFELEALFEELSFAERQRRAVEEKLRETLAHKDHAATVKRLESHPGVGKVLSACFILEVFRPERFKSGAAMARYVGLAPRVRQSGATCRGGPLLKAGQGKLRAVLIEAAWRWRACDKKAEAIYGRLLRNTGNGKKAIVGLARRLAIRLWTMWVRGEAWSPAA
jgi:transposase